MRDEEMFTNRDRVIDSERRRMPKHGVSLKGDVYRNPKRRVRRRGGIREVKKDAVRL